MDKRFKEMNATRKRIMRLCGLLKWIFRLCLVLYALAVMLIVFVAIFPPDGFSYIGPNSFAAFLPMICDVFAGGFVLIIITKMLKSIEKGHSPFTFSSAQQITVLAVVLLVGVISGAFIDPGMQVGAASMSGSISFESAGGKNDAAYIDVRGLILSIICFALLPIFRYGAMLQSETDDLV